jgi:hypothetical protein
MNLFSVVLCSLLGYQHTLQSPSVSPNSLSMRGDVHGGKLAVSGATIQSYAGGTPDLGSSISLRTTNPILPHAELAAAADQFVDSIGINVHLHYDDTLYYTNWPLTLQALQDLRVRHVRDAVINNGLQAYYDRHQQLGSLGFKGIYISSVPVTPAMLRTFIPRVKNAFEGVETINEADSCGDPNWIADVKQNLADNYPIAHSFGGMMIGPSLVQTASPALLGDVSLVADYGNLHNYLAGRNPGTPGWGGPDSLGHFYGSTPFALDNVVNDTPGRPVITTETGYSTDLQGTLNAVTEAAESIYFPRLLLEQWNAGITRTYIYELIDTTEGFGIIRSDGSHKPAFTAISNLLNLLSDKGALFVPRSLTYAISGAGSNLHHALFQKRDGSFWLALWIEAEGYDPDQHLTIKVAAQRVTLITNIPLAMTLYQFDDRGTVTTTPVASGTSHAITVTDRLALIKLVGTPAR